MDRVFSVLFDNAKCQPTHELISNTSDIRFSPQRRHMLRHKVKDTGVPRRSFLTALATGLATSAAALRGAIAQDELHVLKDGNLERLRLDFNTNHERVRLVAFLSPT
jgi:hypothetical protein